MLAYIHEELQEKYAVVEAADGEEALAKAQEFIPDLIIIDVMMPKMDGYQLSRHLRQDEKTSHIRIIMLTARAALDDKIEGLETGVDDYLHFSGLAFLSFECFCRKISIEVSGRSYHREIYCQADYLQIFLSLVIPSYLRVQLFKTVFQSPHCAI